MIKDEKEIEYVYGIYEEWVENKNNILSQPLDEVMSELVFYAYEKGKTEPYELPGIAVLIRKCWDYAKKVDDLKEIVNAFCKCKTAKDLKEQIKKTKKCYSCKKQNDYCYTCKGYSEWEM